MTEEEIYIAVEAMLLKFTDVKVNNIIRAYPGRRVCLPPNNDYIIMTITRADRLETPAGSWTADTYTVTQGKECVMQLDFFGRKAAVRANAIVDFSRNVMMCDFLEPYGILPLYADDISNNTGVSGEKKYVERRTVQLHLNYQTDAAVSVDTFTAVEFNIFKTEL